MAFEVRTTIATQGSRDLDLEMRSFLEAVHLSGGSASGKRTRMPCTSREQDRARQRCRKFGLAYYLNGKWTITDAGRAALDVN